MYTRVKGNSPLAGAGNPSLNELVAEKRIAADSPMVANALLDSLNLALQLRRSPENHRVQSATCKV